MTLKWRKLKLQARTALFPFARATAPTEYQFNWHHRLVYNTLDQFARREIPLLIVEMPPGHGKSEGFSRNLPPFIFGRNPDARIIACSYTQDLAAEMNLDVQRIMDSEVYASIFPRTRLGSSTSRNDAQKPRRNSDIFDIATGRGFYKAAGIGVGITGRRFDFGLIDDPVKDRITANSPTLREMHWRWFTGVFRTRAAKNAVIGITGTRWHEDDLIGRVKSKYPGAVVLTLPALATDLRHPQDPRKVGEALWPWFKSVEQLEAERLTEPRDFAALYQQDPRSEGGTEWDASCFPASMWFDDWPRDMVVRVIALDPSKGKDAKHGDYSAFTLLGMTTDGTIWLEFFLGRMPTTNIVAWGFELFDQFERESGGRVDGFGVESDQFQELLANDFAAETQRRQRFPLPLFKMLTHGVKKEIRIRRLTPLLTNKRIRVRATPGSRLAIRQFQEFPVGSHDDAPDSCEYGVRLAKAFWNGELTMAKRERVSR